MQEEQNRHLCRTQRDVIYRMRQAGNTQNEIGEAIGKNQSSVSKELSRNRGKTRYWPKQADEKAAARKFGKKPRKSVIDDKLKVEITGLLKKKQTPELISGAMRRKRGHHRAPSHETIYQLIMRDKIVGGKLWQCLPINSKRNYRRRSKVCRRGGLRIPNRVSIEERPAVVNDRKRYGDWEVDLIVGANRSGFLLSLYERKSRLAKLCKLETKTAEETALAIIQTLEGYKVRTITYDNGLEFAKHESVSLALGAEGYFCAPYHSWEKGGVENYNRLVRLYYPKGSSFAEIDKHETDRIERELNERPRKVLGFRTPSEYEKKLAA